MSNNISDKSNIARGRILDKLKAVNKNTNGSVPQRHRSVSVFPQPDDLLATFTDELKKVNGEIIICENEKAVFNKLAHLAKEREWNNILCRDPYLIDALDSSFSLLDEDDLKKLEVGITRCEALIARSGSAMVSSAVSLGRLPNIFPPTHCIVAMKSQIVPFLEDAITTLKERYGNDLPSHVTVITGPSRTADIEKTLVLGAHGPKQLIIFIDKNS